MSRIITIGYMSREGQIALRSAGTCVQKSEMKEACETTPVPEKHQVRASVKKNHTIRQQVSRFDSQNDKNVAMPFTCRVEPPCIVRWYTPGEAGWCAPLLNVDRCPYLLDNRTNERESPRFKVFRVIFLRSLSTKNAYNTITEKTTRSREYHIRGDVLKSLFGKKNEELVSALMGHLPHGTDVLLTEEKRHGGSAH